MAFPGALPYLLPVLNTLFGGQVDLNAWFLDTAKAIILDRMKNEGVSLFYDDKQ